MSLAHLTANTNSCLGPYIYAPDYSEQMQKGFADVIFHKGNLLAVGAQIPLIGSLAGITRMALAVIHSVGHLFAAGVRCEIGHLYHTLRGGCAFFQGLIESIPFFGRIFAIVHFASDFVPAVVHQDGR